MADDVIDAPEGASEQVSSIPAEEPSLRDTISAAVAKQREPEEVKPETSKPEEVKPDPKAEGERSRDEQGRFAKGQKEEAAKTEEAAKAPDNKEAPKEDATAVRPPSSWSPTAKSQFAELPKEVQEAVAKRETEVNNGFAKLAEYKPLDSYVQMAKESGTTLHEALSRYVGIENALRQDFVAGTIQLARQQNINPVALAQHILARHGVSPQNGEGGQQQANQTVPAVDLTPIHNELTALKSYIAEQQQAGVQTEIQRFASDAKNVFFDNVKADMGRLIESGQAETLDEAYDKACWANKEIRALLIKQQAAPSARADDAVQRARAADKATGGAPAPGFREAPKVNADASIRDTIVAAVNAQRGM